MSADPSRNQETRNAQARRALLAEFGALGTSELAPGTWALAVPDANSHPVYPAFQFAADGRLHPVVSEVLTRFAVSDMSAWQAALWFTRPTGWLQDRRPVDLLATEPDAVLLAARAFSARPFY